MKKPQTSDGFPLAFALFLLWSWPLGLASILLWAAHVFFSFPALPGRCVAALWMLLAVVRAALTSWGARASQQQDPPKENKNPYSFKEERPAPEPLPAEEEAPQVPSGAPEQEVQPSDAPEQEVQPSDAPEQEAQPSVSPDEAALEETLDRLEQELRPPLELPLHSPGQTAQQGG